jgi:RNA polymerase sigma-70 factor (ECF subfamily)
MTPEEAITWTRIQNRDLPVFENFYKEHYKSFFLLACKYLRDAPAAQEIVNDVFIKLWEDGEKININTSLKAYIYRAVINRSINVLNRNKKDLRDQQELGWRPEATYELRKMEEHELQVKLYAAIDKLPEQCRKVFMMSRFEELKQQEIADRLGISIKTVKNHITYALKNLGTALEKGDMHLLMIVLIKEFFSRNH